jgi:hypothetical protein
MRCALFPTHASEDRLCGANVAAPRIHMYGWACRTEDRDYVESEPSPPTDKESVDTDEAISRPTYAVNVL